MNVKIIGLARLVILFFTLMALTSCGGGGSHSKPKNRVTITTKGDEKKGDKRSIPRDQTIIREVKASTHHQCKNGEKRLARDITLHTTNIYRNAHPMSIQGPFSTGSLSGGGQATSVYVGISIFGDLIFVSKITGGDRNVLGFNITLSMCSFQTYMTDERAPQPDSFQAPTGIVLDDSLDCGHESVLAAQNTTLTTPATQALPIFTALTSFSPTCKSAAPSR